MYNTTSKGSRKSVQPPKRNNSELRKDGKVPQDPVGMSIRDASSMREKKMAVIEMDCNKRNDRVRTDDWARIPVGITAPLNSNWIQTMAGSGVSSGTAPILLGNKFGAPISETSFFA